jgi:hypothetical protein
MQAAERYLEGQFDNVVEEDGVPPAPSSSVQRSAMMAVSIQYDADSMSFNAKNIF